MTNISFNQITVDGDTSTNDMVVVLANGMAERSKCTLKKRSGIALSNLLKQVCQDLANMIARDGEGATKLIEVKWTGAEKDQEAEGLLNQLSVQFSENNGLRFRSNWGRV